MVYINVNINTNININMSEWPSQSLNLQLADNLW